VVCHYIVKGVFAVHTPCRPPGTATAAGKYRTKLRLRYQGEEIMRTLKISTTASGILSGVLAVVAIGLGGSTALGQAAAPAPAPIPQINEYAVKFVCNRAGVSTPNLPVPVAPGFYHTAINVHNPSPGSVEFRKKFAQALPNQKPGKVSEFAGAALKSDEAFDVECTEITKRLGLPPLTFVTGFVVFQIPAPRELDIVAVYTAAAAQNGPVVTMHTARVPKRP
jgi:hypothetical protein